MKKITFSILAAALTLCSCAPKQETMAELQDRVFKVAAEQVKLMDARLSETELPRSIKEDGSYWNSNFKWWCSGFFPGTAWYTYQVTGDEQIKEIAMKNTLKLAEIPEKVDNHDIGFMLWCSYGNALRLTGDDSLLTVLHAGADKLAARFRPGAGILQSWNAREARDWQCPVIIDNMMNLEFLEESTKLFGDSKYEEVAICHALKTIENHFRPDYSSYHVVDYNPETGEIRHKETEQGWADDSSWGRGQAWGLYGYTMMFRETGRQEFIDQAVKIADYIIPNLPEDGVTYWDFNAPDIPTALRDASAAAVMASAFVELSQKVADTEKSAAYLAMGEKIIRTLASEEYLAAPGENANFLLKHSVGFFRKNSEVDVPLTYADYYFLEAIIRYNSI